MRHFSVLAVKAVTTVPWVPVLLVNCAGSFAIGFVAAAWSHKSSAAPLAVTAGLLGGFTTFSAFSLDNLYLAKNGQWPALAVNMVAQCGLGLLLAFAGSAMAGGFKTN